MFNANNSSKNKNFAYYFIWEKNDKKTDIEFDSDIRSAVNFGWDETEDETRIIKKSTVWKSLFDVDFWYGLRERK